MVSKIRSTKRFYPEDTKQEVISMKHSGDSTTAEIMEIPPIKSF